MKLILWPNGINNAGQVIGFSFNIGQNELGFSESAGAYTTIDFPSSPESRALGVNNSGDIVGFYSTGAAQRGFLLDAQGFSTIAFPGAFADIAFGINDRSQIVGSYLPSNSSRAQGFLLSGSTYRTVDVPGATDTELFGINDSREIVGTYAVGSTDYGFIASIPEPPTISLISIGIGFLVLSFTTQRGGSGSITGPGLRAVVHGHTQKPKSRPGERQTLVALQEKRVNSVGLAIRCCTQPNGTLPNAAPVVRLNRSCPQ